MSKSLRNSINIRIFLEEYSSNLLRCIFLQSHYRDTINLSAERIEKAKRFLARWDRLRQIDHQANLADRFCHGQLEMARKIDELLVQAEGHLANDFDTPKCMVNIERIFDMLQDCHPLCHLNAVERVESLFRTLGIEKANHSPIDWNEISLIRTELCKQSLFSLSDRLRQVMMQAGIPVKDGSLL